MIHLNPIQPLFKRTVSKILDRRLHYGKEQVLVSFEGHSPIYNTWIDAKHVILDLLHQRSLAAQTEEKSGTS